MHEKFEKLLVFLKCCLHAVTVIRSEKLRNMNGSRQSKTFNYQKHRFALSLEMLVCSGPNRTSRFLHPDVRADESGHK